MSNEAECTRPLWAVVGNMCSELRNGREPGRRYTGTRVFSAGTKLYLGEVYWGMSEKLHVIGRGRNSARLVNCVIGFELLENVRSQLVYAPARLKSLQRLQAFLNEDREAADEFAGKVVGAIQWLREEAMGRTGSTTSLIDDQMNEGPSMSGTPLRPWGSAPE